MNLKNAALLALVGTGLLTLLLAVKLANNLLAFVNGLIPAATLLSWILYAFAALSLAIFFYVFHRSQS